MAEGKLFVISGPSAVGKGTIVKRIAAENQQMRVSVSATTRQPRIDEKDGINYYFITEERFNSMVDEDGFLEHAHVHENQYGTPAAPVKKFLEEGKDVILEIDVQGAMQVKEKADYGTYIFILPPSLEELRNRIIKRGTESSESIEVRMGKALGEIEYLDRYDYYVINDNLEQAVEAVRAIIASEHQKIDSSSAELLKKFKEEK